MTKTTPTTALPFINQIETGRPTRVVLAAVRIAVGLMWLQNVNWKRPPDFGQAADNGLYQYTADAVKHPVLGAFSWLVENVIFPSFALFGWGVLIAEFCLGAFLLVGFLTRFWAAIGILQTLAITLSVLNTPGEWQWSYYLMFVAQFVILATAAGRIAGVDGLLRPRWSLTRGRPARIAMTLS
ncbi:DoxX family protein [Cryobacterium roopkundense]|uniref:Thiosulfate dehydrogenase [quinone] large subunit n=1 Tax=Cryobacterium roopkundense TaxID=1001240 RepID=A0A7W9E2Z3_9MICO|nr:DoxX family protein [Cryobacterium roopkundense]MBB5641062.1 thiosulfate dehydrogenase [quinone] large subunit [Cryobacterium roopkundense]